ncbi:hypothetical protein [Bifidobacterium catulorum]|uniref:hypothetical protein n=1 Tax=Bifidobacterium catulorum TaxID=1630173 RepID=UPI001F4E2956|nr:hypothetical protein [Bifidobacterium catulorum]
MYTMEQACETIGLKFYGNVLSGATPYVSVLIPSAALAEDGSAEHAPVSAVSEADDDTAFETIS